MNIPKWVYELLSETFTEHEMKVIDANWHTYNQMSFSNSTARQLKAAAHTTFLMANHKAGVDHVR